MTTEKLLAKSWALNWMADDFDASVERLLDSDELTKEQATELLNWSEEEKVSFITSSIQHSADWLCQEINNAISNDISDFFN